MPRLKTAAWYKRGKLWVVRPPDWPKHCELSFTEQEAMQEWAQNNRYMLKCVEKRYATATRSAAKTGAATA